MMWSMEWIKLSYDRDRWQALVNVAINIPVSRNEGNLLTVFKTIRFSRKILFRRLNE